MKDKTLHRPVLAREMIDFLNLSRFAHSKKRGKLIDATFGLGGYERLMVDFDLDILGIEIDPRTINQAQKKLASFKKRFNCRLVQGNFRDIKRIASKEGFTDVDAIIFDLGVSSFQLDSRLYGLSFKYPEAPLDMRLEKEVSALTAADLLNTLDESQLISLFEVVLERGLSKKIAKGVIEIRKNKKFAKVGDLLELINLVLPERKGKLHPATRIFLALRMAVNSELDNLKVALPDSFSLIKKRGRLAVISFHSGEDRVVKNFFGNMSDLGHGVLITKKPITPGNDEVFSNPRCRSAKLRIIEKI